MKLTNKIMIIRLILAIMVLGFLLFPFYQVGISFPTYLINGNILVDLRYIIAGILFVIFMLVGLFSWYMAKKKNRLTDYVMMVTWTCDKMLVDSLLIVLSCNGMISVIIAVAVIVRDVAVDMIKLLAGNKGKLLMVQNVSRLKGFLLIIGVALSLFYNLPFELWNFRVSDLVLVVAAVLSVISGVRYYMMAKNLFSGK